MPMIIQCPFYKRDSYLKLGCECATIKFPDMEARTQYMRQYCGNHINWPKCSIAHCMQNYYDREDGE